MKKEVKENRKFKKKKNGRPNCFISTENYAHLMGGWGELGLKVAL